MTRQELVCAVLFVTVLLGSPGNARAESWSDAARHAALARGADLPQPFGVGLSFLTQDQDYSIDSLTLGIGSIDPAVASGLKIENDTETYHLTADYWLLPFLDIYAILGQVDGTTKVRLSQINIGLPLGDLNIEYDGLLYGAGVVLAYGGKHVFILADLSYSWTDLDVSTSSVEAFVATPRIGYDFGSTSVWVGAMYQDPDERHRGVVDIPGLGPVPYDVSLESRDKWNYTAGLSVALGSHWALSLEGGFGPRTMALAHVDYRFGSSRD